MNTQHHIYSRHFLCPNMHNYGLAKKWSSGSVSEPSFLRPRCSRSFFQYPDRFFFFQDFPSAFPQLSFCLSGWFPVRRFKIQTTSVYLLSQIIFFTNTAFLLYCISPALSSTLPCMLYSTSIQWCSICPLKPSALSHFSHCLRSFLTPLAC